MTRKNYSLKKQNGGNKNMKHNYNYITSKRIDIDSIYSSLRMTISRRAEAQNRQNQLWDVIKRTHSNHDKEMNIINNQIGDATHRINQLISQLCQYKKTHKAMNLACEYLKREIIRTKRIIDSKTQLANDVDRGYASYVTSKGKVHTDTTQQRRYIQKKTEQYHKLQEWLNYVSRYVER